jgi:hypothetical protein
MKEKEKNKKKKDLKVKWYNVVLDMMEEKFKGVLVSAGDELQLMALGDIFKKSELMPFESGVICWRIKKLIESETAKNLGDKSSAYKYLQGLLSQILIDVG